MAGLDDDVMDLIGGLTHPDVSCLTSQLWLLNTYRKTFDFINVRVCVFVGLNAISTGRYSVQII